MGSAKWISEYEQAILDTGIKTFGESLKLQGSACSWNDAGYYHDLMTDVKKIESGQMSQDVAAARIQSRGRYAFVHKYGFAIPNQKALDVIAHFISDSNGVVEVGAGTGYWLYESLKLRPWIGWQTTDAQPPVEGGNRWSDDPVVAMRQQLGMMAIVQADEILGDVLIGS